MTGSVEIIDVDAFEPDIVCVGFKRPTLVVDLTGVEDVDHGPHKRRKNRKDMKRQSL